MKVLSRGRKSTGPAQSCVPSEAEHQNSLVIAALPTNYRYHGIMV